MSAKRILSAFILILWIIASVTESAAQAGKKEPKPQLQLKEKQEKLVQWQLLQGDTIKVQTMRETVPETAYVWITSTRDDTLSYEAPRTSGRPWLRCSPDVPDKLLPKDTLKLTITFDKKVLSILQYDFKDTVLVSFAAPGTMVEDTIKEIPIDTVKIPVHLKIIPTLTEKMAGWISKASNTTINVIYWVFLGLFGTWVYFALLNVSELRNTKFIGKDIKKLRNEIDNKIKGAKTEISREEYLEELKKGGGSSPLFTSLRNAAAECEFYDNFENHSESVNKRIQDQIENAPSLSYFQMLANVAPSIGFFGTLIGMTHLLMGRAITVGEASEFAHYISYFSQGLLQAIVTSIIGLFLLVLSMLATFGFSKKAESIQEDMLDSVKKIMEKVKL